ncbi:MAG: HEPN-associated N-terminal domain-containing protein [Gemmatimonadales bacterium]
MTSGSLAICLDCVGDRVLRQQLRGTAWELRCTYCKHTRPSVSLDKLAEHADPALRRVLRPGAESLHFDADSDSARWEQDGQDLGFFLQGLLHIDCDPAEALVDILVDQDPADPLDGEEPFYARDGLYELAETTNWEFAVAWRDFSEKLKHDQRFFGSDTAGYLGRILGKPGTPEAAELPCFFETGDCLMTDAPSGPGWQIYSHFGVPNFVGEREIDRLAALA